MYRIVELSILSLTLLSYVLCQTEEPTHIVKFKPFSAKSAGNTSKEDSGTRTNFFEASEMLLNHHKEFVTSVRRKKITLGSIGKNETIVTDSKKLCLNRIDIGHDFNVVSGVFSDHAFLDYLHRQPTVEYVEPNQVFKTTGIASQQKRIVKEYDVEDQIQRTDVYSLKASRPANWGLARINQRQKEKFEDYIYDSIGGTGIEVFVLDTGVYVDHLDFDMRASHSANMIQHEDNNDMGGHGTHVAAKIAGSEYGVSKAATIRSVKILNKMGDGSTSTLLKGIEHVIRVAKPGKSLINLSLSGPHSRLVDDALDALVLKHNIPVFASAGNAGTDACYFTPSSNPNVFSVGATDKNDKVPRYSNVGECVSIYAPGSSIVSAYVGGNDSSKSMDGTSMASPHVTGTAANLLSKNSFSTVHDLYNAIRALATRDLLEFDTERNTSPNNNMLAYNSVF